MEYVDEDGARVWQYGYDPIGSSRLTSVTPPVGTGWEFSYSDWGWVTSVRTPQRFQLSVRLRSFNVCALPLTLANAILNTLVLSMDSLLHEV
jgi:hypothetical protein